MIGISEQDGYLLMDIGSFEEWLSEQKVERVVRRIQNHHTWKPDYSGFTGTNHFRLQSAMGRYHDEKWNDGIAQHITIFPDGQICMGRSLSKRPIGIAGANSGSICIEIIGNFDIGKDVMTEVHRDSILKCNAILCQFFGLTPSTETLIYHTWWKSSKTCPGTNFFGGNTKAVAAANFVPLVQAELDNLENPPKVIENTITETIIDYSEGLQDKIEYATDNIAIWKEETKDAQSNPPSLTDKIIAIILIIGFLWAITMGIKTLRT